MRLEAFQSYEYDSEDDDLSSVSSNESSSLHDLRPNSEIVELQRAIHDTITNLFKLSMVIRRPTPRGRYAASKNTQPFDASFDVAHVWHKFPHARDRDWLIERLGKANTRRREYFRYRREHRRKLGIEGFPITEDTKTESNADIVHEQDHPRSALEERQKTDGKPTVDPTKATTFVNMPRIYELPLIDEDDVSLTSYATTTRDNFLQVLRVPDPHNIIEEGMRFENEKPFECPYCCTFQVVKNFREWR